MINLAHLKYVQVIARLGSFSAAARETGVSQPAISIAIADLEEQLHGKLFLRTTRHVELTELGVRVLHQINVVLDAVGELEREAASFLAPDRRVVRIAFSPVVDSRFLMALLEPFRARNLNYDFVFKECGVADMEERLDRGQVEVICGIRLREGAGRSRAILYRDVLRFLPRGGIDQQARAKQRISLACVAEDSLIFTGGACGFAPLVRDIFKARKLDLKEYPGEAMSFQVVQDWTEIGIGAAILPGRHITGDPTAYPVVEFESEPIEVECSAVWNEERSENGMHIALQDFLAKELHLQELAPEPNEASQRTSLQSGARA